MRYMAEWNDEDGNPQHKIFNSERDAYEFAHDAYADCLVSVSIRSFYFKTIELEREYLDFIAE